MFLDVDGVLNPDDDDGFPTSWPGSWRCMGSPSGARVWLSAEQGAALRSLEVDIVWATSWGHSPDDLEWLAEELGFPYGMPRLEWRPYEDMGTESCGKQPGVERFLAGTRRPAVWVDDCLGPGDLAFVEARRRLAPIEAFAPDPQQASTRRCCWRSPRSSPAAIDRQSTNATRPVVEAPVGVTAPVSR
jgi:hypothetical protein